jgi:hypothetical protein
MSRRPQPFRQSDVTKALKAAAKAGITVSHFEIDKNGKIIVVIGKPHAAAEVTAEQNEWDEVLR